MLDYASKQFDKNNSVVNFFDDLNAKQITWLTKNSEAFQKFLVARKVYDDEKATDEEKDAALNDMLDSLVLLQDEAENYNLSNITEQIENIGKVSDASAKSISEAYSTINDNADAWYKAQTEFDAVQKQMDEGGTPT